MSRPFSRRTLLHCFWLLIACTAVAFSQNAQNRCPPCYTDEVPLSGHGPARDGSGRHLLTVEVDTSAWGSPPPANVVTGAQNAPNLWNSQKTYYYFPRPEEMSQRLGQWPAANIINSLLTVINAGR